MNDKCPVKRPRGSDAARPRKLLATEFQNNDARHLEIVRKMGISIVSLPDGRVQLLHSLANVRDLF